LINRRRILCLALIAAGLAVAACASPAVTGIKVHMQNGEYQEAVTLADSVIAGGDSLNAELWIWRGKAQGNLRDWQGAAQSFDRACRIDPALGAEIQDYWFVFYNSAAEFVAVEDFNSARADLENGKALFPDRPEFDQMLGDIALGNDDYALAIRHFEQAWAISSPLIASYREMLDTATEDSAEPIQEALDAATSNGLLSLFNAATLHKSLFYTSGTPEEGQAHLASAEGLLTQAIELDPTNADVLNLLAQVYLLEDRFDDAMSVFDDALAGIEQGLAEGWLTEDDARDLRGQITVTRGVALLEQEMYPEAIAQLESARGLLGDDYIVLGNLSQAYIMSENYAAALSTLDETLLIEDLNEEQLANTWYMKFAALTKLERDTEAATALETALEITPDNPDWWEFLASTYSRLGRRNDAIDAMENAERLRSRP